MVIGFEQMYLKFTCAWILPALGFWVRWVTKLPTGAHTNFNFCYRSVIQKLLEIRPKALHIIIVHLSCQAMAYSLKFKLRIK